MEKRPILRDLELQGAEDFALRALVDALFDRLDNPNKDTRGKNERDITEVSVRPSEDGYGSL